MMPTAERVRTEEVLERAFDRKRSNFIDDYELREKPALIWQAWPTEDVVLDVTNVLLREAMRAGGGDVADDGWWYGFQASRQLKLVFDGIAAGSDSVAPGWATEVHVDGHVSAAVWIFPEVRGSENSVAGVAGVADFYAAAFRDFTFLASKVFAAAGVAGSVYVTATMHHADKLPYLSDPGRVVVPPSKRRTLRWPIAAFEATELMGAGSVMAAQFARTYGRKPPKN